MTSSIFYKIVSLIALCLLNVVCFGQTPRLLKDITVGASGSDPTQLSNANNMLHFVANNQNLWRATAKNIASIQALSGNALEITTLNGTVFFVTNHEAYGAELWKLGANGATLVKDIQSGIVGSMPSGLTVVGNFIYFTADDGINGAELWRTDGSTVGTTMVKNILVGDISSNPQWLTEFNNQLYFVANNSTNGRELWKSDGTANGTVLVKDIREGTVGSFPQALTKTTNALFFVADDGINGCELWRTDGTNTTLVSDLRKGSLGSVPYNLVAINSTLFFAANDGEKGVELYKSSGSSIELVADIAQGEAGSSIRFLTNVKGSLYFSANNGVNGAELWKSDGTANGTTMITDIWAGNQSSDPRYITEIRGWAYFVANNGTKGDELWKSNGTAQTTTCMKDLFPGLESSMPDQLVAVGDTLFVAANDGTSGREVWRFDPCRLQARISNKTLLNACASTQMSIKGVGSNCPDVKYEWTSKPAGIAGKDSTLIFTVPTTVIAKKYKIYYKVSDATTSSVDSTEILVMPHTPLAIATKDTSLCSNQSISLKSFVANYDNFFNHNWTENSFTGNIIDNPESVRPSKSTVYFLSTNTIYGCVDTARIVVRINDYKSELLQLKVILEGPYNSASNLMTTELNVNGLLPGQKPASTFGTSTPAGQPFNISPWNLKETKTITLPYANDVVDWVYISVRTNPDDIKSTIFKTAALLRKDGSVTNTGGCTYFFSNQKYYVGIDHRNHLGAVSHQPANLSNNLLQYDFTTQQSYIPTGVPAYGQQKIGNKYVLYAADFKKTSVGEINADDATIWRATNGQFAKYMQADANLDGKVNALDNNFWLQNKGIFTRVGF